MRAKTSLLLPLHQLFYLLKSLSPFLFELHDLVQLPLFMYWMELVIVSFLLML